MATECHVCKDKMSVALEDFDGNLIRILYDLDIICQCFHGVSALWWGLGHSLSNSLLFAYDKINPC